MWEIVRCKVKGFIEERERERWSDRADALSTLFLSSDVRIFAPSSHTFWETKA